MERIIALNRSTIQSDRQSFGKLDLPRRHFFVFRLDPDWLPWRPPIPYAMPAQLIVLIAFFALALCHFVDTMFHQKNDQNLKAIFQASPNPIIVYSKLGHPQNLNPAFTQVFGWSLDELSGRC